MKISDWQLALRNLLRNRRRSLSTLIALAIGLAAIMLFSGFKSNLGYTMLTAYVRAGGHVQIQHRDYFLYGSANPTAYGIADYEALLERIRGDEVVGRMVAVATPMLRFGGLAGNFEAGISRTIIGTGFVADDVARMRQWNEFGVPLSRPQFALQGAAPDAAIVGVGVARVLQLCARLKMADCPTPEGAPVAEAPRPPTPTPKPGQRQPRAPKGTPAGPAVLADDIAALAQAEVAGNTQRAAAAPGSARIELLSSSSRGAPNVAALNVVAAEDQGFKELDEVSVITQLAQAQRLVFGRTEPKVTAVMVLLNRTADEDEALARLQQIAQDFRPAGGAAQPLVARSFGELNPFYVQSEQLFDVIFHFIFVLIGGIVLFTVSNTMNTAVVERTVEIGTLRAIGLRQGGIRNLFVAEGFILGVIGTVLGIVAAVILGALVNQAGLTWLPPGSSERLPLQLRVFGDLPTIIGSAIGLAAIATLSAWWPARRAANLNVVEALRHA
jgi:putative ABC transport system permease protein